MVEGGEAIRQALEGLIRAAAPIEEDGGSEAQREAFSEAFQNACFALSPPEKSLQGANDG